MMELLWFLLPVAAASGWWAARREPVRSGDVRQSSADYIKGLNYLLDDKPDQALEVFLRMPHLDRDTAETHLTLGNLFRRRGEVDRAIRIHSNLIAKVTLTHQQRSRALLELGEDYLRAGLFDRAESLFRQLVEQTDHTTVALERLVAIYEREKDWEQAIVHSDLRARLTGQPKKTATAHYCCELAEEALQQGHRATARDYLNQALARDPTCARASLLFGRLTMAEGDYPAAIAAFQAVEGKASYYLAEVIHPLSECYVALGQPHQLIAYLRNIQGCDQTGRVTDALAKLLVQQEGEAVALQFLEAELRRYPTLLGLRRYVELKLARSEGISHVDLEALYQISKRMLSSIAFYQCENCGFICKSLHWCCPGCTNWGSVKPLPDPACRGSA
jgi:lipopolysaccharide biosynthesis regulator YciM